VAERKFYMMRDRPNQGRDWTLGRSHEFDIRRLSVTNVQKLMLASCAGIGLLIGGATMAADSQGGFGDGGGSRGFAGWHHHGGFGERRRGGELRELGQVGLSDAQKGQIIGLIKANRTKFQAVRQEEIDARKALDLVQPGDANYSSALDNAATKIADATRQRVELEGQLRVSIDGVLTSDQRAKLATLRTQAEYRRVFGGGGQDGRGWQAQGGPAAQ